MKEWLCRWKNRIMSLFTVAVVLVSVFATSFVSRASGLEFFVSYAEPATSDTQGYVTLLLENRDSGELAVETYFWHCVAVNSNGSESPCFMTLNIGSGHITFNPAGTAGATSCHYSVSVISTGQNYMLRTASSSSAYTVDLDYWGWKVQGVKYSGNVGDVVKTNVPDSYQFFIYFSEHGSAILLLEVIELLTTSNEISASTLTAVYDILNSVDGIENQLSSVIAYLNTSNNLIQQILDILKQTSETEEIDPEQVQPDENVSNLGDAEDAVLGTQKPSDVQGSLDVQVSASANDSIWTIIEQFVTSNGVVFGAYISLLTLGVVCLVLNR